MKYYVVRDKATHNLMGVMPTMERAEFLRIILESYNMEYGIGSAEEDYLIEEVEEFPQT